MSCITSVWQEPKPKERLPDLGADYVAAAVSAPVYRCKLTYGLRRKRGCVTITVVKRGSVRVLYSGAQQ
jgi:hypothetical protein